MLVRDGREAQDIFTPVADDAALPEGAALVSLKRFLAEKNALLARPSPLAVALETDESPEALGNDVHKLAAIVLHIPRFRDGRAFSWARLLRTRMAYEGEIRVSGHFLLDQIAFYARVGVNAFDVGQRLTIAEMEHALREISDVYQPAVDGRRTIRELRSSRA